MADQQHQISKLAGKLTEYQRHFGAMPTEDRQWAIEHPEEAISLLAGAVKNRAGVEVKKLLKYLRTVPLLAIKEFDASKKFHKDKTTDGVPIGWLGSNFEANFAGKVEKNISALELKEYELEVVSRDLPIIVELGGEEVVETSLGHFFEYLKSADKNRWHVRYIRDVHGVLWAVSARWDGDGWSVGAGSLGDPDGWLAGELFASR